jgi:hypothetical protein
MSFVYVMGYVTGYIWQLHYILVFALSRSIAWSTTIPLSNPACHLLGPFDFQLPASHPTIAVLSPLPYGTETSCSAKLAASCLLLSLLLLGPVGFLAPLANALTSLKMCFLS